MGLLPTLVDPITEVRVRREYISTNNSESISGGGWRLRAQINYNRMFPLPPEPSRSENWEIGFIQNVLGVNCRCRYDSGRPVQVVNSAHWLDAERPGTQAWIHRYAITVVENQAERLHPWVPISYGGGGFSLIGAPSTNSVQLSMQDFPKTQYYNFLGNNTRIQLREVNDQIRFKVWLAARRTSSPQNDPRSYHIIAVTNEFTLTYGLTIAAMNSNLGYQSRGAIAAGNPGGAISNPVPTCHITYVGWTQANLRTPRPVVAGPTANEGLGALLNQQRIGPLTRWGA